MAHHKRKLLLLSYEHIPSVSMRCTNFLQQVFDMLHPDDMLYTDLVCLYNRVPGSMVFLATFWKWLVSFWDYFLKRIPMLGWNSMAY